MPPAALLGTAKTSELKSGGWFPRECTFRELSQNILLCALRTCTCAVSPHNWSDLVHLTDVPLIRSLGVPEGVAGMFSLS